MLELSGSKKTDACLDFKKLEDKLGPAGVTQLMKCDGKYPENFKEFRSFCQSCAISGNLTRLCLPSVPVLFQDQHDGDRKVVTLSGNKLNITSFGTGDRYPNDSAISVISE